MENGIIEVIDELGRLITKYKDEIKFKDYEIDALKKRIEQIESYSAFYNQDLTSEDYNQSVKRA